MNPINRKKWISAVHECRTHLTRIHQALARLSNRFPLTQAVTKLQDTIGTKVFPFGLQILGEETTAMPFIDQLSRLEQVGFIQSVEKWMEWRALRNDLDHEYPDTKANSDPLNLQNSYR